MTSKRPEAFRAFLFFFAFILYGIDRGYLCSLVVIF